MKTLPFCLGLVQASEQELVKSFAAMAERHSQDFEIKQSCKLFAKWSEAHLQKLGGFAERYGIAANPDPARVRRALFHGLRMGGYGLMRDLQDLLLLVHQTRSAWTALIQALKEMKQAEAAEEAVTCAGETDRQIDWLCTHIKVAAPQALTVPVDLLDETKDFAKNARNVLVGAALLGAVGVLLLNLRLSRP